MYEKYFFIYVLTKHKMDIIILAVTANGEVAQLARAFGSYPKGHVFESHLRYQKTHKFINIYEFYFFQMLK